MHRRDFFANTLKLAAFSAFLGDAVSPEDLLAAAAEVPDSSPHQQFWDSFFDDVDPTKRHVVSRDSAQPVTEHAEPGKVPRYFHYDDSNGLRFAENIDRNELAKLEGAALVSVSISGFHSSDTDAKKIGDVAAAQLQLHAIQTSPIAQYIAPLAWASLASVFADKAGKLPTVEQLNFLPQDGSGSSSSVSRVLFPKAEGKFAVNVTLPQKNSLLHKMITNGLKAAQLAAPLVSLPAISVPAIKAFTSFYNILQQNAGFIINSPLKDAVASYSAVDSGNMHADALKLLTGQYVVVPTASSESLSKQMTGLKLVNGYLVPRSLTQSDDPTVAARNSLRDITYATLKVSVEQAASMVTAETPRGAPPASAQPSDAQPSDTPSGDSSSPGKSKPKPKPKPPV